MICYKEEKRDKASKGESQLRGRMGKLLYWRCLRASGEEKSAKEKNL